MGTLKCDIKRLVEENEHLRKEHLGRLATQRSVDSAAVRDGDAARRYRQV